MLRAVTALILAALPAVAAGQAPQCVPPASIPRPRPDLPTKEQPKRLLPTGGYTLALSWSPEHCRTRLRDAGSRFQCAGPRPRFGFVLHGLWPDGRGKDWPQYCAPAAILPQAVLRANLCATPSPQLLQHEWAKHGTCMTNNPSAYFSRARLLYERVRLPDMDALSRRPALTAGDVADAFATANRAMRPDMLRVTVTRRGWLDEVWLCLDTQFRQARCPSHQGGANPRAKLRIWRGRA